MHRILYVDDEPSLLEIAKLFLEQTNDFSVDVDTAAQHALQYISTQSYDAVISDYQMPEMDGIAFLKAVRERFGDIPFILFTGRGREEVVIDAINNGADFYLQKGGDPTAQFAELAHKIRQAIARRQAEFSLIESEKLLTDIINFLPDATFAIDRSGHVIAWNRAIEEMTGVAAADMMGKGDYEYAIPFYGDRRPILIDLIFESDEKIEKNYAHIIHEKDMLIADTSLPRPKGRTVILMGTASPLYNRQGDIVGAIESIRDITRLKRAEEGLLHAQKDWETIFRAIGNPAIVLDPNNRIIDANDSALTVTGKSLEDLTGMHCYEVFHRTDSGKPPDNCPFEQLKKTGTIQSADMEIQALNGYYHISCTPVYDASGRLEKVIHIAMDVTARRRIQDELRAAYEQLSASQEELRGQYDELSMSEQRIRESEEKFRTLFNNANDAIYIHEVLPDGTPAKFLEMNDNLCSRLGYTREELLTMTIRDIVSDAHRQKMPGIISQMEKTGFYTFYGEHKRKDGSVFPVEITSRRFTLSGKEIVMATAHDITERKRAEDALHQSEEKYRTLVETTGTGFVIIDDRGRVMDANPEYVRLTGHTNLGEITGRSVMEWTAANEGERKKNEEAIRQCMKDGFIRNLEVDYTDASGKIIPIEINATVLRAGESVQILTLCRDISERRKLQEYGNRLSALKEELIGTAPLEKKLKRITDSIIDIFGADFARIWISGPGDLCKQGCIHAPVSEGPHVCKSRAFCLHLVASSGRYTHIDGGHRRVPFGAYKIGRIATGEETFFITNDVTNDPRVHDHAWAGSLGLVSFAGFRLVSAEGEPIGVLAFFSRQPLTSDLTDLLKDLAATTSQVIRTGQVEGILSENEEKYRTLVETTSDLIWEVDAAGIFTYVSPKVREMLGYEPGEMIGKTPFDYMPPDEANRVASVFKRCVESRLPIITLENKNIHKDGSVVVLETSGVPRYAKDGSFTGYHGIDRDITGRKRAEEALREREEALFTSQQMLQLVLDTIPQRVFWKDRNSVFLGCNMPLAIDAGFSKPSDMVGKTDYDHASAETADLYRADDRYVMETGQSKVNYEEPQVRSDGSRAWLRTSKVPLRDKEGNIIGVLGTYDDITSQKQAEEALRESEEQYKKIFNSFVDIYYETDKKGIIVVLSPSVYGRSGWKLEELIGKHISILYANPSDRQVLLEKIAREQAVDAFEVLLKKRDGTEVPVSVNARIRYTASGEPDGLQGSIRDITEYSRARKALQESEAKYRHIIENLQDVYFQTDLDGNISMVSPSAAQMYGYDSPDEMIGIPAVTLYYYPEQRAEMLRRLQEQGKIKDFIGEGRRKDGTKFWASLSVQFRVDEEGHILATEAIVRDITERKDMEQAIHEINRKLILLTSITRHDVANQVSILRGFAKIAMMKKPDPVIVDLLTKIDEAGSVISRQIEFTRAYQELGMHAPGWQRISEIVARQKPDTISLLCTCNAEVFADPMLEKVFLNLIDNAARHGEHVTTVAVSCSPDTDGLVITVEDNGAGVPLNLKEKIFEKGYGKHTGFGLFLAREILAITGISIHETGMHGKGARFEIKVPKGKYRGIT